MAKRGPGRPRIVPRDSDEPETPEEKADRLRANWRRSYRKHKTRFRLKRRVNKPHQGRPDPRVAYNYPFDEYYNSKENKAYIDARVALRAACRPDLDRVRYLKSKYPELPVEGPRLSPEEVAQAEINYRKLLRELRIRFNRDPDTGRRLDGRVRRPGSG